MSRDACFHSILPVPVLCCNAISAVTTLNAATKPSLSLPHEVLALVSSRPHSHSLISNQVLSSNKFIRLVLQSSRGKAQVHCWLVWMERHSLLGLCEMTEETAGPLATDIIIHMPVDDQSLKLKRKTSK